MGRINKVDPTQICIMENFNKRLCKNVWSFRYACKLLDEVPERECCGCDMAFVLLYEERSKKLPCGYFDLNMEGGMPPWRPNIHQTVSIQLGV